MPVNKDNFYKRLEKIEQKSPTAHKKTVVRPEKRPKTRTGKRRPWLAILVMLLLAGGGAGYYFKDRLSPLVSDLKLSLLELQTLRSSDPTVAKGDQKPLIPGVLRVVSLYGGLVHSPAVVSQNDDTLLMADIASGFAPITGEVSPKLLKTFDKNEICEFRAPKWTEKIYSVNVDYGLIKTQVKAFTNQHIAGKIKAFLDWNMNPKYTRKRPMEEFLVSGKVNAVDVFVTDTSAPLYLVLQSFKLPTIWNIHAADGVKISHIALNSPGVSGVVLPDADISVEAINYRDVRVADSDKRKKQKKARDGSSPNPCDAQPWRKPKEHWGQWIKADNSDGVYRNQRDTYFEYARGYDKWFRTVFGQGAEENLTEAEAAAHVLLGPRPEQKIPYHALSESEVLLTRTDHVILADDDARKTQILALQNSILDQITGGGFDKVDPGYMEVEQ